MTSLCSGSIVSIKLQNMNGKGVAVAAATV
nr:MAG TPA: hypothetical protein [Caudoviricetes sp.]